MSRIAELLGGSKTTLWTYFSSKEQLFAAVVDDLVDRFAEELEDVLVGQRASLKAVRLFCLRFLGLLTSGDSARFFRLIMGEGERFPELGQLFYACGPARLLPQVAAFLATTGEFEAAERLANVMVDAMLGFRTHLLMRMHQPDVSELEGFVNDLVMSIAWPEAIIPGTRTGP